MDLVRSVNHESTSLSYCSVVGFPVIYHIYVPNRGKGDYFRLGHGTDVHVRKPQMVEGLRGKKIVHVAVGALHCLAVTETGQVRSDLHHPQSHQSSSLRTHSHGSVPAL